MEIRQLRALCIISETGNFREAAEKLRLTQPALSHQIRKLEEELGETLLVRTKPRVVATPAGQFVVSIATRILSEVGEINERFPRPTDGPISGNLRVAGTNLAIAYLFGDLCEQFIREYPLIELDFKATETPEEAVKKVLAGAVDVAFGPVPDSRSHLEVVELGTTEHVFIVSTDHALASRRNLTLDKLREWPFIRFEDGSGSRAMSDLVFSGTGGYPPIVTESNDTEFVKRVTAMGIGVALVPVFALNRNNEASKLHVIRLSGKDLVVKFGLICRSNVRRKPLELLKQLCLRLRGDIPPHITIENAGDNPFAKGRACNVVQDVETRGSSN